MKLIKKMPADVLIREIAKNNSFSDFAGRKNILTNLIKSYI